MSASNVQTESLAMPGDKRQAESPTPQAKKRNLSSSRWTIEEETAFYRASLLATEPLDFDELRAAVATKSLQQVRDWYYRQIRKISALLQESGVLTSEKSPTHNLGAFKCFYEVKLKEPEISQADLALKVCASNG
jgi:hypothetical protein